MKKLIYLIIVFLIFMVFDLSGQIPSRIVFLNGKEIKISSYEIKDNQLIFTKINKTKLRKLDTYDIFSIIDSNNFEKVIYVPDTTYEEYSISEMREFIKGEQWAIISYNNKFDYISGFSSGIAGSYLTNFYGAGLAVPFIYPKIRTELSRKKFDKEPYYKYLLENGITDNRLLLTTEFLNGYHDKKYKLKMKRTLIGGGVGLISGFILIKALK